MDGQKYFSSTYNSPRDFRMLQEYLLIYNITLSRTRSSSNLSFSKDHVCKVFWYNSKLSSNRPIVNSTILSCYPILIPVVKRKPILLVDKSDDSTKAIDLFNRSGIEYVEYDIRKFEESCCDELPTTKAPSVFAVEGVFKGLEKINEYVSLKRKRSDSKVESECAYW